MFVEPGRFLGRHAAWAVCAGALVLNAGHAAHADDAQNFFSSIFGGQPQQQEGAPAAPRTDDVTTRAYPFRPSTYPSRPLTVKLHRPKVHSVAAVPTKPGKVSIFQDRTLRRGDAVMTMHGMRIFAGSSNWPYKDGDFVAIAQASQLDKQIQKTLVSLDALPR